MKDLQQGFGLILLIIGLALFAILFAVYFTRGGEQTKSQYEVGQEAIEQAREIQQGSPQTKQLQEEIDIQNTLNAN